MGKAVGGELMAELEEVTEEPLSPAERLFHTRQLNCIIVAIIGCKTTIDSNVIKAGLERTLIKHPRFSSLLASMEAIRGSLAEELVQMTEQCEKFRAEAAFLPGIRAELEALRRRHSSALELMGERDEELEELRADIVDLKEMYREQVNMLVNQIQRATSSAGTV